MAFAATATAVGIGAGTLGVAAPYKQAHDLFRQQINQDRRFFVADWAETSWRHSEALAQSERHHAEDYMLNLTQYWQADKFHRREFRQGMMFHQREVDIMLRAETREALRDELLFQNNRMNNVQLCDTVCLGVAFTVAVEGVMPPESSRVLVVMYAAFIGAAILFLSASLWLSFILIRRLNLYTAGIMHAMIDMERVKRDREILEEFDPVATSEEFQAWMQRHCVWLRTSSLFALSGGVIMLFAASGTLLQARFNYSFNDKQYAAMVVFWSFAAVTVVFITTLELKEHAISKEKRGVYSMKWKDALRRRRHQFQKNAAELVKLSEDVRDTVHREVEQEEQTAFKKCADVDAVAERGAQYSKLAVDRRLMRGKTRSVLFETLDLPGDTWTPEETKMQLRDVIQEVRSLDEQHANNVDGTTKKQSMSSLAPQALKTGSAAGENNDGATGADAVTVVGELPIVDANGRVVDMNMLRKEAGQFFRSTLVHVRNGTDSTINLRGKTAESGVYEESVGEYDLAVPREIPAGGEGVFLARGRALGGVSGEVEYMSRNTHWSFKLRWFNYVMVGDDGRHCETDIVCNKPEVEDKEPYRIYKDDDDQTVNNEVYFSIKETSHETAAAALHGQAGGGSGSAISAGWLQVKPDSDWVWAKRWVSLTAKKLVYFGSQTEKVKEGELRVADVTDVYPSGPTELSLAGTDSQVQVEAGSQQFFNLDSQQPPQLPLRLWFESIVERDAWMAAFMVASPLLASRNRTSGMDMETALDELAKHQIEKAMNFDQLLAMYYRIIHGDMQKVIDTRQTFSPASKLTSDEATEAMLLLLVRVLTEEQLQHEWHAAVSEGGPDLTGTPDSHNIMSRADDEMLFPSRVSPDLFSPADQSDPTLSHTSEDGEAADSTDRPFLAKEWVDVVMRWGGANVWSGLRKRGDVLKVGQRLLDAGLLCVTSGLDSAEKHLFVEGVEGDVLQAVVAAARYRFVPMRLACAASALATANMHAPTEEEDEKPSRWKRSTSHNETAELDSFTAAEATGWLVARGGSMDHNDGPASLCAELCRFGLLVLAQPGNNDDGSDQRYDLRHCEGHWEMRLVNAEATDVPVQPPQSLPGTGPSDAPEVPTTQEDGAQPVALDVTFDDAAQHLHTPSRDEFMRHAGQDGNETMSRGELVGMLVAESIPIHDDYLESIFPTPNSAIEYDAFVSCYKMFQKIQAGQRQFQQHKDEIRAGAAGSSRKKKRP